MCQRKICLTSGTDQAEVMLPVRRKDRSLLGRIMQRSRQAPDPPEPWVALVVSGWGGRRWHGKDHVRHPCAASSKSLVGFARTPIPRILRYKPLPISAQAPSRQRDEGQTRNRSTYLSKFNGCNCRSVAVALLALHAPTCWPSPKGAVEVLVHFPVAGDTAPRQQENRLRWGKRYRSTGLFRSF